MPIPFVERDVRLEHLRQEGWSTVTAIHVPTGICEEGYGKSYYIASGNAIRALRARLDREGEG